MLSLEPRLDGMSRNGRDMKRTWLAVPILVFALVVAWEGSGRGEQPFIILDEAKIQATGYAGCNRFFGGYELERSALTFGTIGATKRACPDLEEAVETEFFKVLDATRGWRIVDGTLELLNGDLVLARLHPHHGS